MTQREYIITFWYESMDGKLPGNKADMVDRYVLLLNSLKHGGTTLEEALSSSLRNKIIEKCLYKGVKNKKGQARFITIMEEALNKATTIVWPIELIPIDDDTKARLEEARKKEEEERKKEAEYVRVGKPLDLTLFKNIPETTPIMDDDEFIKMMEEEGLEDE